VLLDSQANMMILLPNFASCIIFIMVQGRLCSGELVEVEVVSLPAWVMFGENELAKAFV